MALRGSLNDMGIIDLIQFPHAGRKTGMLIIASPEDDARLFYRDGQLLHAQMGEEVGLEALSHLVDWGEGEFEFRPDDVEPDARTIEVDLHRAIMQALKMRDEARLKEQEQEEAENMEGELVARVSAVLEAFADKLDYVEYSGVIDTKGNVIAQRGAAKHVEKLQLLACEIIENPPRDSFKRLFFDDELGTAVISQFAEDKILIVCANAEANLGAVSVAVNRINGALLEDVR